MANNFEMEWYILNPSAASSSMCTDGTYAWLYTRNSLSTEMRLWRLRLSDKQLIKPDGSIGDTTNAFVTVGTYNVYNFTVTNGTNVLLLKNNTANAIGIYRNSDMAYLGDVAGLSASQVGAAEYAAYYNGNYYVPGWDSSTGRGAIYLINATNFSVSKPYVSSSASTTAIVLILNGNFAYISMTGIGVNYVEKVDITNWTRSWSANTSTVLFNSLSYDTTRGELWAGIPDGECIRMRDSDGAFLDRAGTVQPYATARITSGGDCLIGASSGVFTHGGQVYTGGYASPYGFQRRSVSIVAPAGTSYAAHSNGYLYSLPAHVTGMFVHDNTLYCTLLRRSSGAWGNAGFAWMKLDTTLVTPNVTDVSFAAGPTVQVTFDSAVTANGTTTGAPLGKLAINSATMGNATRLDVAMTLTPPALTSVVGNLGDVQLTFDELITYGGSWTQTPVGANYIIAQPSLDGPHTTLTIPVTAGAAVPRVINAAKAATGGVLLEFNGPVSLAPGIDLGVAVGGVRVANATLPTVSSTLLTLAVLAGGTAEWFPSPQNVIGVGAAPYVHTAYAEDSSHFILIFNEEVDEAGATNPSNYAISPSLDILGISRIGTTTYRMETSRQTANVLYQVTLTGIVDRAHNAI